MTRTDRAERFLEHLCQRAADDVPAAFAAPMIDADNLDAFVAATRDTLTDARRMVIALEHLLGDAVAGLGALEEP